MKQSKIIFTIVATLIGAGFASGQEIYTFFYVHGIKGLYGLIICCTLLATIVFKVLSIINSYNIESYKDFIFLLFGKTGFIINLIITVFLIITFFIMLAGFGAFFSQEIKINSYIGSGILTFLCFLTFMINKNAILNVSSIIVPIMIFFIILIGFINFNFIDISYTANMIKNHSCSFNWLLSSMLYTSYNSILLVPALITFKKYINNKTKILSISFFSGLFLLILSISIFFMLTKIKIDISNLEMPVLYVIRYYYSSFIHIYAFIILASIYTTAISVGVSFLNNISFSEGLYPQIVLIMCITGFVISGFGFSNLVGKLYPLFGYLGILQIALLFFKTSKGT